MSGQAVFVGSFALVVAVLGCKSHQAQRPESDGAPGQPGALKATSDDLTRRHRLEAAAAAKPQSAEEAAQAALEATYPLHGVVSHYLAQIFVEPSNRSRIVGYMRRGAKFRAKAAVQGRGCSQGFHEIPGGGFVCNGRGFQVGATPQNFDPSPVPPSLREALPYPYARTARSDVPQFWRFPGTDEEYQALDVMQRMREEEARLYTDAGVGGAGSGRAATGDDESLSQADEVDAPPPPGQNGEVGTDPQAPDSAYTIPDFLRMRMRPGFYVSLDRLEVAEDGRRYYRTVRGGYVQADALIEVIPPAMRGVVLGGTWKLPLGFVYRGGVHGLRKETESGALRDLGIVERHMPVVIEDEFDRGGKRYFVGRDGMVIRKGSLRVARVQRRPPKIPGGVRWIHIRLSEQTLVAYEGDTPVFATLVSSGEEEHKTPLGVFQIQSKHISATMDDDTSPDSAYSIEDVPYAMYFQGNYALHGAFWHNGFGVVRSHGCVNLAPVDARWLFQWTTPTLPASWHGVFGDSKRAGTWIFIEE